MARALVKLSLGVVLWLVLSALPADATEYYVNGNDGNDAWDGLCDIHDGGTCGPVRAIQAAAALATSDGDIVNILPARYTAGFTVGAANAGTTFRGVGEAVIAAGTCLVEGATGVRFETLTFRNSGTQLTVLDSSGVTIERCRFIGGNFGAAVQGSSEQVVVRKCLFAQNGNTGLHESVDDGDLRIDRCTFVDNGAALYGGGGSAGTLVANSVLSGNTNGSEGDAAFSYCNFAGDPGPCPNPGPTNSCDPPNFIDPDNLVYYVRAGSPLLSQGEGGGPVGAFGQGFHNSKDVANDEPPGTFAWGGWIAADEFNNPDGTTIYYSFSADNPEPGSPVVLNDDNEVILTDGAVPAAIYSPVFNTGSQFTVINSIDFAAFEDIDQAPGFRQVIDFDASTPQREIRIRTSLQPFSWDPRTGPPLQSVDKHVKFSERAQYVQIELVLRNDGDLPQQ